MKSDISKEMSLPFITANKRDDINISFEFFPPNSEKMAETLWTSVENLAPIDPEFVSVTYGAGGSTRDRTHDVISKIKKKTNLEVAAHLTCVGSSKQEIRDIAQQYWDLGIKHIVAIRGDLSKDYDEQKEDFKHACDLIDFLKTIEDFEITVGAYPEKHPEAKSLDEDINNLKHKVDAGADRIISQFFMEPKTYLNFVEKIRDKGIITPINPGILPITNFEQSFEFAKQCHVDVPVWMQDLFFKLENQPMTKRLIAATVATEQCRVLYEHGVKNFHIYTLNRHELSLAICHMLGKRKKLNHLI